MIKSIKIIQPFVEKISQHMKGPEYFVILLKSGKLQKQKKQFK